MRFTLFFGLYAEFYWLLCQHCTLRVHRNVSMGSIFFEKNAFQFVFHIFGGNFWGFRQNVSSIVIRTALVSRFFNRNYATLFRIWSKILLDGLSELHSTCQQDCFSWEASSLKKMLFKLYFTFLAQTFQVFGKTFPSR